MTMSSIQRITKGDIIVERVGAKNKMIPVRKVEFNACSSMGVHVNTNMCYDYNAVVQLADGDGTLSDLETALGDLEEDFPTEEDLRQAYLGSIEAWADRLVRQ